jgi:UDP-arabinose 4-epimerase
MRVLVTGGAGYIGSHTAKELARAGHEPVVLYNLKRGHRWAVRWGPLVEMDLGEREGVIGLFRRERFDAVIHFAALAYVGESVLAPAEYFQNNVVNTIHLLDAMRESGVQRIVFSSSCATYGNPLATPIREEHPRQPVNPYGESKLMGERLLRWYGDAYGIAWTALRYFNAAGADPEGEIGEVHDPETHLIPRALAAAAAELSELEVMGTDYPTPDRTAIRDYIHVTDLASAHITALNRLPAASYGSVFNLGTGKGSSVQEVIAAVERVTRRPVPVRRCARRSGDPPELVADASKAMRELGWKPVHSGLDSIIETAWRWTKNYRQRVSY